MMLDLSNQRGREVEAGEAAAQEDGAEAADLENGDERNFNDFKNKMHVQSIQSIAIDTAIMPSEDHHSSYNHLSLL
jgi:hypothetical protein